jgi:hypothetical protein
MKKQTVNMERYLLDVISQKLKGRNVA